MELQRLLQAAVEHGASDLHVQSGAVPMLRLRGEMRTLEVPPVENAELQSAIAAIVPERHRADLEHSLSDGIDFSYQVDGLGRFRCSAYLHLGHAAMVARVIRSDILSFDQLHLPEVIRDFALSRRGLTMVTGTTGSGKSTTLAAMVDLINESYRTKIVTLEDPIEYIHENRNSLISQLEVGSDTPSFQQGIRQALRQDPDIILVGELRDVDTLRIALQAADTGHQVLTTVHSANAAQTVERVIAMFPPAEHKLLLSQLAGSIESIISQRLVKTADGDRYPAVEILRGGPVTTKLIQEQRIDELSDFIAEGESGMRTFDQHLLEMYRKDLISGREAMRWSSSPEGMAMAMRGIRGLGSGQES